MARTSAGVVLYRRRPGGIEVFLVHPGGPFWARMDRAAWSIPKGEPAAGEALLAAARREFEEETGFVPAGKFRPLPPCRQVGGKVVRAWAVEGDCDPEAITSNTFRMEWPRNSGLIQEFPEVDRAAWFDLETARKKVHRGQLPLLDALARMLADRDAAD